MPIGFEEYVEKFLDDIADIAAPGSIAEEILTGIGFERNRLPLSNNKENSREYWYSVGRSIADGCISGSNDLEQLIHAVARYYPSASFGWNLPQNPRDPCLGLPPLPELSLPVDPFKNLESFNESDAMIFFGRCNEINELHKKITNRVSQIVLLYGASGVGKSSLLNAGLIPRIKSKYAVAYRRRDEPAWDLTGLLQKTLSQRGTTENSKPLLIILDQLESAWHQPTTRRKEEIYQFTKALKKLFDTDFSANQGSLLLSFRKEYLAEVGYELRKARLSYETVFIRHLDHTGIIDAIRGPSRYTEFHFKIQNELPMLIADTLLMDKGSTVAPTLQILLSKMWKVCQENCEYEFTIAMFQKIIRKGDVIRHFFEEQLGQVRVLFRSEHDSGLVLDLLRFHTYETGKTRSRDGSELEDRYGLERQGQIKKLVNCLKRYYILAAPSYTSERNTTRLIHDILAPIVRDLFEQSDLPGQRSHRIFMNRIGDWSSGNSGSCLDETDLNTVEIGIYGMKSLDEDGKRMLEASKKFRKTKRIWKSVRVVIGILSILSIITLSFRAEYRREHEKVRRISAEAVNQVNEDLDRALLLGLEAYNLSYEEGLMASLPLVNAKKDVASLQTATTESMLRILTSVPPELDSFLHGHPEEYVRHLAFDPSAGYLFSRSRSGLINIWSTDRNELVRKPWLSDIKHGVPRYFRLMNPTLNDHQLIYSTERGFIVRNWDTGEILFEKTFGNGYDGEIREILFIPKLTPGNDSSPFSSSMVAIGWRMGRVTFWNSSTWERIPLELPHIPNLAGIFSMDFKPGQNLLAIGTLNENSQDQQSKKTSCITLINLETMQIESGPECRPGILNNIVIHPHKDVIVSGWRDSTALITKYPLQPLDDSQKLTEFRASVTEVQFLDDGALLAAASWDGSITLYETENWSKNDSVRFFHNGVMTLTAEQRGKNIASSDYNNRIALLSVKRLWKAHDSGSNALFVLGEGGRILTAGTENNLGNIKQSRMVNQENLEVHTIEESLGPKISTTGYNPEKDLFASGTLEGVVHFYKGSDLSPIQELRSTISKDREASQVRAISMNRNGSLGVFSAEPNKILVSNLSKENLITRQQEVGFLISSIVFGANGQEIATICQVSEESNLRYWDVDIKNEPPLIGALDVSVPKGSGLLSVSPDGKHLAVASGGVELRIFKWKQLDPESTLDAHPDKIRSLLFVDNNHIAAGYDQGSVIIWDITTQLPVYAPLRRHRYPVLIMARYSGGLITLDSQSYLTFWESKNMIPIAEAACNIANRNLTIDEWQQYLGGAYSLTCPDLPAGMKSWALSN